MLVQHQPLTVADLLPGGPLRRLGHQVFLHDTIDSTNAFLLRHATTAGDGAVAWAEWQTAGRGRLGRRWEAPRGSSVLLSVLLIEPEDSPLLSRSATLATVAACEAIESVTECTPQVRWPNDIMLRNRKLGGVLAETCATGRPGWRAVVIGVGINCFQQRGHFRGELADRATSLECESSSPVDRSQLAASLLVRLDHWLTATPPDAELCASLHRAWLTKCQDVGTRAVLEHDGRLFSGTVLEVTDQAGLLVQLDDGGRRSFDPDTTTRVA